MNTHEIFIFILVIIVAIVTYYIFYIIELLINNPYILKGKDEKLVGIISINFSIINDVYGGGDWDEVAINHSVTNHLVDVYCYENEVGKRKLNINPYAYYGSHSIITRTADYVKLLDWKSGRSNLYGLPSYQQVINGEAIITPQA